MVEHLKLLEWIGVYSIAVKTETDLKSIDALIIPGGESTTISKLLTIFDLKKPLQERINTGLPVLGTCAGLILLSAKVDGADGFFAGLSCSVARNAYGAQLASGEAKVMYPGDIEENVAFIRAPKITDLGRTTPIAWVDDEAVAVAEGNILGASYHPELTDSTTLHRKLIDLINAG